MADKNKLLLSGAGSLKLLIITAIGIIKSMDNWQRDFNACFICETNVILYTF